MIKIHKYEDYKANFLNAMANKDYNIAKSYADDLLKIEKSIGNNNIKDLISDALKLIPNSFTPYSAFKPIENEFHIIRGWLGNL